LLEIVATLPIPEPQAPVITYESRMQARKQQSKSKFSHPPNDPMGVNIKEIG